MTRDQAFWNGEPCDARRVRVIVGDAPEHPRYWAKHLIGRARNAVEITVRNYRHGEADETFYIDDETGEGWAKVTEGKGSPRWGHRDLAVQEVIEDRDAPVRPPARDRNVQAT